jgi:hypothetical protein
VRPRGFVVALLASFVLMAAWIASAPPASNPDGGFHLVSIWCAEGTNDTDCLPIPGEPDFVLVPRELATSFCYAYDPLRTAACTQEFAGADTPLFSRVGDSNLTGKRPELYYRTMHRLKGDEFLPSVTRMRAANALAGIVLFTLTSLLATPSVRRGLHGAWLLTSVPLGVWLLSTTNTGAWMIAGVGTAWANLLTATDPRAPIGRRVAAAGLAVLGAVMGLGARTEAAVPVLTAVAAVAIVRAPRIRRSGSQLGARGLLHIGAAVLAVLALVVLVTVLLPDTARVANPLASFTEGLEVLRGRRAGNPLLHLLLTMPSLLMGGLGVGWGLGWIDVLVPVPVGGIVFGLWSGMLLAGLSRATRRQAIAVGLLGAVAVAFPTYTLAVNGLFVGEAFQPRMFVVLLYFIVGFALLDESGSAWRATRSRRIAIVAALGIAHSHLLHQNTRRYVTGLRPEIYFDLSRDAEWWWQNYPIGPTTNWILGSIAFVMIAWALSSALGTPDRHGPGRGASSGRRAPARP